MAHLKAATRAKSATVHSKDGKAKFPIPDKEHAILAEGRKNQAKPPLSSSQKAALNKRAATFGVGPGAKKNKASKKGS